MTSEKPVSIALIVTTINDAGSIMKALGRGCETNGWSFFVIGDKKGPKFFDCGAQFYSLERQLETDFSYARACPVGHYARKNVGYLLAMSHGVEIIVETDDDNMPSPDFWNPRSRYVEVAMDQSQGWVNVYRYFSDSLIWPRGLPLDAIKQPISPYTTLDRKRVDCPIQQGLADGNPDVDAIYRLILPLPQNFVPSRRIALGVGTWCPFNSQNTTWWAETFPLLYLPAHCSFRMTDIWRSLIAQRIAWECGWSVLFHAATVYQERNDHNLMQDFCDEVSGYLNNRKLADALSGLVLKKGAHHIPENMLICYETLVSLGLVDHAELSLLEQWLSDISNIKATVGPQ